MPYLFQILLFSVYNFFRYFSKLRDKLKRPFSFFLSDGEKVGFLLGIPVTEYHKCLTKPKVKVGTEMVNKGQNLNQVTYSIAALSKAMYERMFWWLVSRVNKALDTKERRSYFIGVLDIAGFEIFDVSLYLTYLLQFLTPPVLLPK